MKIKNFILSLFLLVFVLGCGGFQTSSYFLSDGIYYESPNLVKKNNSDKTKYYSKYFQNLGDNYSSLNGNEEYFIDSENYFSPNSNDQLLWGDNVSQTEVIFMNYGFPRYWGFYNQGYYNPFYFNRFGFYNRYNGLAYGWGFHNPYYSPFYSPFYNPYYSPYYSPFYRPFYNPFYNPYDPFYASRGYYNRQYYSDIDYKKRKSYNLSKSNSRRGEKNYPNSKTNDKEISSNSTNKSDSELDIRTALNRLNVGRGRYLGSRITSSLRNSADNQLGSKSIGSLTKRPQISGRNVNTSKGSSINKTGRGFSSSSVRNYSREINRSREVNSNRQYYRETYRERYRDNNSSNRNNFQRNNSYNNTQRNSSYGRSYSPSRSYSSGRSSGNSSNSRSSSGGSSRGSRPQ